ncbi:MAG: AI-2E family transporter [bacterium]
MANGSIENNRLTRLFYGLAATILLGFLLYIGRSVFIPLVVAIFLSFLIVSLQKMIESTPVVGRIMPDWLSFIFSFIVIALMIFLLVQVIIGNVNSLIVKLPLYKENILQIFVSLETYLRGFAFLEPVLADFDMQNTGQRAIGFFTGYLDEMGQAIQSLGANIVTILLYTSFILVERGRVVKKLGIIAGDHQDRLDVDEILNDIGSLVRQYISVKTMTSLIVAAISYVIMLLLGIDFAGFWALLIFSLNFIPIIGSIIAVFLPSVLALVQPENGGIVLFALTLGLLTLAEQIVGSIIEPRLLGRSLNLSPLIILLSLSVWGALWGFAGMLLCIPIIVAIMIILSQFEETRAIAVLLSDNGQISPIRQHAAPSPPNNVSAQ